MEPWVQGLGMAALALVAWVAWRTWRYSRRTSALGALGPGAKQVRSVPVRILAQPGALPGFPSRVRREVADLALTADRFLLLLDRGPLLDLGIGTEARGRPLESARCPDHGLLVLEGSTPYPEGAAPFRLELSFRDAADWAEALQPFVVPPPGAPRYAVRPPW